MTRYVLIDTGPLVASINRRDRFHAWARERLGQTPLPIVTCEAVLAEACFLLQGIHGGSEAVLQFVRREIIQVDFCLAGHISSVAALMAKYADVPMALADACLVRMCELYDNCEVMTLDADFLIYRQKGRQTIPVAMPPDLL